MCRIPDQLKGDIRAETSPGKRDFKRGHLRQGQRGLFRDASSAPSHRQQNGSEGKLGGNAHARPIIVNTKTLRQAPDVSFHYTPRA
ncbi:MAG: hypothetical protein ACI9WU_005385 [Myxococcota bacterium]